MNGEQDRPLHPHYYRIPGKVETEEDMIRMVLCKQERLLKDLYPHDENGYLERIEKYRADPFNNKTFFLGPKHYDQINYDLMTRFKKKEEELLLTIHNLRLQLQRYSTKEKQFEKLNDDKIELRRMYKENEDLRRMFDNQLLKEYPKHFKIESLQTKIRELEHTLEQRTEENQKLIEKLSSSKESILLLRNKLNYLSKEERIPRWSKEQEEDRDTINKYSKNDSLAINKEIRVYKKIEHLENENFQMKKLAQEFSQPRVYKEEYPEVNEAIQGILLKKEIAELKERIHEIENKKENTFEQELLIQAFILRLELSRLVLQKEKKESRFDIMSSSQSSYSKNSFALEFRNEIEFRDVACQTSIGTVIEVLSTKKEKSTQTEINQKSLSLIVSSNRLSESSERYTSTKDLIQSLEPIQTSKFNKSVECSLQAPPSRFIKNEVEIHSSKRSRREGVDSPKIPTETNGVSLQQSYALLGNESILSLPFGAVNSLVTSKVVELTSPQMQDPKHIDEVGKALLPSSGLGDRVSSVLSLNPFNQTAGFCRTRDAGLLSAKYLN